MPAKGGRQSKILKKNDVVSLNSKDNYVLQVFLKLSTSPLHKLTRPKNKFGIKTTEEMIQNECENFVVHNIDVTTVDKILKNLGVAKASGIDQISAKFLKDGAPVIAYSSR